MEKQTSIISKLASSLNRRDEVPNQELAKVIADNSDRNAVRELVENLQNKSTAIQSNCIKVLYEIGELKPSLISGYVKEFIALLEHKNNRLQWGAMTAISAVTLENSKEVYAALPKIAEAASKGSVITKDHAVKILIRLCSVKQYYRNAFPLLLEQILNSPVNQLPTYAENTVPVVKEEDRDLFVKTLTSRLDDIETDTKRKRLEKVIKHMRRSS